MTIVQETLYFLSRDDASGHVEYTCRSDDKTDMYNKENYNKGTNCSGKVLGNPINKNVEGLFLSFKKVISKC